MADDASGSSGDHLPGGNKRNRGWEGQELELEHARQNQGTEKVNVAVDLEQFRNHQIGQGYQAKFVVRQRTGEEPGSHKEDRTGKMARYDESRDNSNSQKSFATRSTTENPLSKYLECEALRKFIKELEKIEQTST